VILVRQLPGDRFALRWPNDQVQQRGRLERSHATKSRSAGPVCCNGWLGDVIPLESNPDPFVFPLFSFDFLLA
jgi:hypothetical protein